MTKIVTAVRPPVNPATDEFVKTSWYRGPGYEDPWLDRLERDGWQVVPRGLPPSLRINAKYMDYRDAVRGYRYSIDRYLDKKTKVEKRPWWRRMLSTSPTYRQLDPYRRQLGSFADVYFVDPKLAITGLKVFLDPPLRSGTAPHMACQNVVVKTFEAIAEHRIQDIPDNLYATALHCLDLILQSGLEPVALASLKRSREVLAKRK